MGICYEAEAEIVLRKNFTQQELALLVPYQCEYEERGISGCVLMWSCDGKGDWEEVMRCLRAVAAESWLVHWRADYMGRRQWREEFMTPFTAEEFSVFIEDERKSADEYEGEINNGKLPDWYPRDRAVKDLERMRNRIKELQRLHDS